MEYKYPAGAGGAGGAADTAKSILLTVRNNTGVTIPERSPVYINGALGNRPTVALAYNTSEARSTKVIGFTVNDILDNADGDVIAFGRLEKVSTSGFSPGQKLYLGSAPGSITTTEPSAPKHMVFLGIVVTADPANGVIEVQVQNGFELEELHNVQIASVANKQTIIYDSATSLWKNGLLPAGNLAPSAPDANKALVRDASGNVVSAPIVNANIDPAADIAVSKLASLTANTLVVTDSSGKLAANSGTVSNNEVVAYNAGTLYTVAGVTNTKVGYLSNVTSDIQAQINSKLATTLKGAPNGLAELDGAGKVPSSQLPSYVDDVLEYANLAAFPVTGTDGIIYIALDTNLCYRWGGSTYVEISPSLALGETSTTAYRGDRGKTAYDHSQTTGNPHSTAIGNISGLQTALDGKFDDPTGTSVQYLAGDGTVQSFPTYYLANKVIVKAQNFSGATIPKGSPVSSSGAGTGLLFIDLASSNSYLNNEKFLGLTNETILDGAQGEVVICGLLENINTSGFLPGQSLYLGTAGTILFNPPLAPNYKILLGTCITQDATIGSIFVLPKKGSDFSENKNVLITSASNGQILTYESATALWKNKTLLKASNNLLIAQVGHGLSLGEAVYLNGSVYTKALASAANTAEVVGIVSRIVDVDNFELTLSGEITGLSGLTAGGVYFLSSAVAGVVTMLEPTAIGQISIPLAVAKSTTSLYVDIKRGVVIGGANARTQIALANSATTSVQDVSSYDAGELAGWVHISGTASQKFYVQAQFVKGADAVYDIAYQVVGDTPPVGFSITVTSVGVIQAVMPSIAGFTSAFINYALNAPAVGASLPLSIDSTNINVVDSAPLSYRNRIVNGAFQVAQRGTSFTLTAAAAVAYGLDRWYASCSGANTTLAQVAGSNGNSYALRITGAASNTGTLVGQRIEAQNCYDMVNKTVTCSLRVSSTSITSLTWAAYYANSADTFSAKTQIATGTLTISSTDSGYSFSFNAGANAANGIAIEFTTGALLGSQTITYQQVQLELGAKSSSFERRPIGMELDLCKRYYERIFFGAYFISARANNSSINVALSLPQTLNKRIQTSDLTLTFSAGQCSDYAGVSSNLTPNTYSFNTGYFLAVGSYTFPSNAPLSCFLDDARLSAEL